MEIHVKILLPPMFINMICQFHDGMQASVRDNWESLKPFLATNGVKQGCVLAPTLFNMYFTAMVSDAFRDDDEVGVKFYLCIDGDFYKPQRLKKHSKVQVDFLHDSSSFFVRYEGVNLQI